MNILIFYMVIMSSMGYGDSHASMAATMTCSLNQQKDTKLLRGDLRQDLRKRSKIIGKARYKYAHFLLSPNSIPILTLELTLKDKNGFC